MEPFFVLVHSLALGPSSWGPVARELASAGYQVRLPSLVHVVDGESEPPFWPAIVSVVHEDLGQVPTDQSVVLVAHSNAGRVLPVIRAGLDHPVSASVFVDAALPARVGQTQATSPEQLESLRAKAVNGRVPRWTDWWGEAEIAPMFPDPVVRQAIVEEQPELPIEYYEQAIPVPEGWDDHPCSYLLFSAEGYEAEAAEARERGWRVAHLPGEHLHQIIDPVGTARLLIDLAT